MTRNRRFVCTVGNISTAWREGIAALPAAVPVISAGGQNPLEYIEVNTPADAIVFCVMAADYTGELLPAILQSGQVLACQTSDTPPAWWSEIVIANPPRLNESITQSSIAILAQWHPYYLAKGQRWLSVLRAQPDCSAFDWMADSIGKYRLLEKIEKGVEVCVYFGHGRLGKLVGYHGIAASDFVATDKVAIGSMLSFACYATARNRQTPSFGEQLVNQGVATTFLGCREASDKVQNSEVEDLVLEHLVKPGCLSMIMLLREVNRSLLKQNDKKQLSLWCSYTLLGNPLL